VDALADVANLDTTLATHDASHGGLAVALAEMVHGDAGTDVTIEGAGTAAELLFGERPGRLVVESSDPGAVRDAVGDAAPVARIGTATDTGRLDVAVGDGAVSATAERIASLRSVLADEMA
jgi:phosphoribosylformylglycinamidine synthase